MKDAVFDIVLSDYNLPRHTFPDILKVVRAHDAEVPIIVISGSIGEENAVALMRESVADFIFKGNMSRLVPAIERELAASKQQAARRESDQRFRDIVEVSGDWIWETDAEHRYTFFSTNIRMRNGPIRPAASARRRGRPPASMPRRMSTGRRIFPTSMPISRSAISCSPSFGRRLASSHLDERRACRRHGRHVSRLSRDGNRRNADRRGVLARRGSGNAAPRRGGEHIRRLGDLRRRATRSSWPTRHSGNSFPKSPT